AIHDLDIARWLMGSLGKNEPDSNPSEAIDTSNILIEFESGSTATIQRKKLITMPAQVRGNTRAPLFSLTLGQVCRRATYGYDQRVEFFGTGGLTKHENLFPNQVQKWTGQSVQQADLPYDAFMDRYVDAYK
ncbi:unnamed protein product, partial [Discosporangium mesarthrocarpum]